MGPGSPRHIDYSCLGVERMDGERLRAAAPLSEYEADRYYGKLVVLCQTHDSLPADALFDE